MKNKIFILFLFGAILAGNIRAQNVVMNEIYSRGTTTDPDWIELYNKSNAAIDISGYKIYDAGGQGGTKAKKPIPSGTTIPAKGFYVVVTDDGAADAFGLSSSGEKVWLENAAGTIVDTITFAAHSATQSYARIPDGGTWQVVNAITRGVTNGTTGELTTIVMNEIYSRGTTAAPDWIELYNTTSAAIDVSGYKIYDIGGQGGTKAKKAIPSGTTIPAKGYFVIVVDDGAADGFGLSSSGETVWFEDASGKIIDSVLFLAHNETQSYARVPDGGTWQVANTITKGATNSGGTAVNEKSINPGDFVLFQNYPNPFNPTTAISYHIPAGGNVSVKIYDAMGRMVKELVNEYQTAGVHTVVYNAEGLSSGIYYYTVKSGSFTATKKLVFMK